MKKKKVQRVSVIIPVYKPDMNTLKKVREMLKKQTIKAEIIEMWNNPEAVSMNGGIIKARGEIIVTLMQDCIPQGKNWLKRLIKPLEKAKFIIAESNTYLPEWYWKKYPFLTKILTLNELRVLSPGGMRAGAYRKKDLIKVGMFNENPKVVAIDADIAIKLENMGTFSYPGIIVNHLHPLDNKKKLILNLRYAEARGKLFRGGILKKYSWRAVLRATPLLGILPIIYVFPWEKFNRYWYWFFPYLLSAPLQNIIYVYGFWKGFLFDRESERNKEVLRQKDSKN